MQDKKITLKDNSKVRIFKLFIEPAREGKILVGTRETNSYLVIDIFWKPFIKKLEKGIKLTELARELSILDSTNFPKDESIDKVKIMTMLLVQNNLIQEIDGIKIHESSNKIRGKKNKYKNYLFRLFLFIIAILFSIAVLNLYNHFPLPNDFFWNKYLSLCLVSSFLFTWGSAFLHESSHLLIGKFNGIKGRLRLSHRLNFLVVETYFPDIYSIGKKGRIAIYISGIIIDLAIVNFLYLIKNGSNHLIINQFILLDWLSILWQFLFFMKTDIYYVIKELVGIENLYTFAKTRFLRIFENKEELTLSKRERKIVNIYTIFFGIGTIVGIFRYGFYHLPILIILILGSIEKILTGINLGNTTILLDGLTVLVIEGVLNFLLVYTLIK